MGYTWLPETPAHWHWMRRRRTLVVDSDLVFARAEQAIAIAERLRPAAADPRVVAAIGELHTLARDLLRWAR